jgi:hypothetical protein
LRVFIVGGSSDSLLILPPFLSQLFFNHKTIQLCQKIKKAKETRAAVAAVTVAVAVLKEDLHQPIKKQEKEYHGKAVRLPVMVAAEKKVVKAKVVKVAK